MRIVISTGIFPPDIGGPASYVPVMSRWLMDRGHSVSVICLSDDLDHDDAVYPFPVRRIRRGLFKPLRGLRTLLEIFRQARRADLVYVNGLGFESALASTLARVPAVHKIVGDSAWERARNRGWFGGTIDEYQDAAKGILLRSLDWIRTTPLRLARGIIVPSGYLRQLVTGWAIPAERITVVYNSVNNGASREAEVSSPLCEFSGPTMITVCRLVPWKGLAALIDTLTAFGDLRLVILGDGPLEDTLRSRAQERGVGDRTLFMGHVPRNAVQAYLAAADLFVLNSSYEGLPHVVLEAMRAGVPVVATAAGGTSEVVSDGQTGLLVPPGDPEALRGAIREILNRPERARQLASSATTSLGTRFSFDEMVHRTENILTTACARSGLCH